MGQLGAWGIQHVWHDPGNGAMLSRASVFVGYVRPLQTKGAAPVIYPPNRVQRLAAPCGST